MHLNHKVAKNNLIFRLTFFDQSALQPQTPLDEQEIVSAGNSWRHQHYRTAEMAVIKVSRLFVYPIQPLLPYS